MRKKITLPTIVVIFSLLLIAQLHAQQTSIVGKVVGVTDGDTITVLQNKTQYKIRLYGIDTPEKNQDYGSKSKLFTSSLVFGQEVKVDTETTDRYGRTVGMVYIGDLCANEEIVKNGFAWVYRKYCDKPLCNDWLKFEEQARNNKLGLWGLNNPIPPWDFRHGTQYTTPSTSIKPQEVSEGYHGNIKSKIFHRPGCRYYNCKNCTATFSSKTDAINAGYRACKVCNP